MRLGGTRDAMGSKQMSVNWWCGDEEMATSRRFTRWIDDDLRRLGVGRLDLLAPMHDDDAWRAEVKDAAHPAGTTRMSATPVDGVVDPDLQVHGVTGLFVAGSSVFPTSGYANPTLTIVALALRLAGHLERLRGGAGARHGRGSPCSTRGSDGAVGGGDEVVEGGGDLGR